MASSLRGSADADLLNGSGADRAREFSTMEMTKVQFKNLYEGMKEQYGVLLESHEECKRNLEKSMEDNRQMQEKFKNLLDKLQMENRKKQNQIEEMKSQLLDNTKIDQIRDRLSSEIEGPYKLTIQQLGTQLEQTQGELTKVRLDLNARTKEFASELTQKDQILNEIQLKSEKELFSLRKERDLLQQQLRLGNDKDLNEEQIRTRELIHSKGKIDQLIDELNQLQQEKLHAEQIAANAQRELIKETSMNKTRISLLENERDSLKQQFNSIHQELASAQDQLTRVNRQGHDKDLRLAQLNSELENVQHRLKVDTANHRIDLAKVQREYLEQHEQVKLRIQDLEEKIAALNADKSKLQLTIQEKEHQLLTNIQSTREDEWKKISEITNEKLDLEAQVNILKKSQDEREKQFELERDRLIEQIRSMEKSRDELQKDNHQLNATIKQMNDCQADLEKEQDKCRDLYRKCVKLESQLGSTNGIEQELTDMNLKLKNELNQMVNECHANKQEVHQMNNQCTSTIENARRAFFTERKEMEKKIEHLIEQLKQCKAKINELQKEKKDHRKKYQNFTQKLAEKSQLIDAKLNEIKQKEMSLQNVVSVQTHNRLKRQLAQLLRKHAQFQDVLNVPQTNQSKNETNDDFDLHTMINRLDRLSHQQNDQLKDFLPVKESADVPPLRRPITSSSNGLSSSSATSKEKRRIFPLHGDQREDEEEEIRFHSP